MKEINCNVANDLIPLYLDDVLSKDSKMLLQEHMKTCSQCKGMAENMKKDLPVPEDKDINPFKKLQKKILIRTILIGLAMLVLCITYIACDLVILPVHYVDENLISSMKVVEMEEGLFLRRENLAVRGDVMIVDDRNGEVKLYLGENIFERFQMGWQEKLTYTQIAPAEISFGIAPITKVSYCDKDGNVLYVLWEAEI